MNPLLLLGVVTAGFYYWSVRKAAEAAKATKEALVGDVEGAVEDLGASPLPSNDVALDKRTSDPTAPGVYVIPRLLEIVAPAHGSEVSREGVAGRTYPVTIRWTNSLVMDWEASLRATVQEGDEPSREIDLGRWVIKGGSDRTAIVKLSFGGWLFNPGTTLVRLTLRFGDHTAFAGYYVD